MEGLETYASGDAERLQVLQRYAILDTAPEPEFDRMAELAAHVAGAPVAFLNFVGRERAFAKARFGTAVVNMPRALSPCAEAMFCREALVFADARNEPRYAAHPLVVGEPRFRAYAGVPVRSREGVPLGSVCVLDPVAREFTASQLRGLRLIASQVEQMLERRRDARERVHKRNEPALYLDGEWKVRDASPAAVALLGLPHEPRGMPLSALLSQEAVASLRAAAELPNAPPADFIWRERNYHACLHAIEGGLLVALRDITDQVQRAESERRAKDLLDALLDGSQDAIFAKDLAGRYTLVNATAARFLGRSEEEIIGRTDAELVPEHEAQAHISRDLSVIGAGRTTTFEAEKQVGDELRTLLTSKGVLRGRDGSVLGVFGISRDITDRKQTEHALAVGEERLRLAMEAGRMGAWDWDTAGHRLCVSGSTQELVGMPPATQLEGEEAEKLVLPEDKPAVRAALRTAIHQGTEVQCDFRVPRAGGIRWLHARGRSLTDGSGKVVRIVGVVSDVTAQKEQEARAQQLARFQEQLFGIVSHDLRSPLSAIRVWAQTVAREGGNARATRASERIVHSSSRMDRMISDLLDFTRARLGGGLPLERASADLHEICAQVVEELGAASPGRVSLATSGDGRGTFDASRMAQVVSNLVGNALQHTPEGTQVEVRVRGLEDALELSVHNGGPAIPADVLPRLFEPFRRGEASKASANLGLGLYITREAVHAHGGFIEVTSCPGEGTTFKVVIPRAPK